MKSYGGLTGLSSGLVLIPCYGFSFVDLVEMRGYGYGTSV